MQIKVNRFVSDNDTTLSACSVDDEFVCFMVEDEYRVDKVAGETRIPWGDYRVVLYTQGNFHARYSERYSFHRGMLMVEDVPGFTGILIHTGNTDEDTAGCLLPNYGVMAKPGAMAGQASRDAYVKLYQMVVDAADRGELYIQIRDNDR